jgi:hypothetical protein
VLKNVKIARVDKGTYKFFLVSGDEPFHWGSAESKSDVLIGLPWNFMYKSLDDINVSDLRVFGDQVVNWDSKNGKRLLQTLVLNEMEQKFAIAHEICMTNNYRRITTPALFVACVFFGVFVRGIVDKHPQLVKLSAAAKRACKIGGFVMALMNFIVMRNALNIYYQTEADIRAAETGPEYFDGALQYYTKMLQRGKAYRSLLGEEGPKYFTAEGDERRPLWHYLFINRSLPYYVRLQKLNDHKNVHYTGDED